MDASQHTRNIQPKNLIEVNGNSKSNLTTITNMSLRTSLGRFTGLRYQNGLRNVMHAFYRSNPINLSLRSLRWYRSLEYIGDNPYPGFVGHVGPGLAYTEDIQGVVHDENNWYITHSDYYRKEGIVYKVPISVDLKAVTRRNSVIRVIPEHLLKESYWHYGALDYYNNHLFIAIDAPIESKFGKVVVYRASDMEFLGSADLTHNIDGKAPWCAINPRNGFLYTSEGFTSPSFTSPNFKNRNLILKVYQPILSGSGFSLNYKGEFELYDNDGSVIRVSKYRLTEYGITGGAFSPKGDFYIVIDAHPGRIIVFDMVFGRKFAEIIIDYKPGFPYYQELEGITIWNLDNIKTANNIKGHIHLQMLDNNASLFNPQLNLDELFFKHFKVSEPDKL